jgi:hypothetical protein
VHKVLGVFKTPLTLILLLVLLIGGFWWGWRQVTAPVPTTPPEPCVVVDLSDGRLHSTQVTVRVYNAGSVGGRASRVATNLRAKGFTVQRVSNWEEAVDKTVVVGAKADNPEVKLVVPFFKEAEVREDGRPDNTVDIIIGNDYPGFNDTAPTSIAVEGKKACVPVTPTPAG